jgi:hypothetical protein
MNKETKTLIGIGVLGILAYLVWKQNQDKKNLITNSKKLNCCGS